MTRRRSTTLGSALFLLAACTGLALAAPPELVEEELAPSAPATETRAPAPATETLRPIAPAGETRRPAVPYGEGAAPLSGSAGIPTSVNREPSGEGAAALAPAGESASVPPRPTVVTLDNGDISYVVRKGESLSLIAEMFHADIAELLRLNRLGPAGAVMAGQTLRIPNPYAAQVRALRAQVQQQSMQLEEAHRRSEATAAEMQSLHGRIEELDGAARSLRQDVRALPRWRAAAVSVGVAAVLLLGIATLCVVDWFLLRRRFYTLAEMNESLRRLDHKYKSLFAKAELRFQQLYGRRRPGMPESQNPGKIPEEFEIDRLNQELKEVLRWNLERLGPRGKRSGRRLKELMGGVAPPAEARSRR